MLTQPHHNIKPLRKYLLTAALLFATQAHAQTVATIPQADLPIHYHVEAPKNDSGWFALPLPATQLPGSTGYMVRLEMDAWVNASTQNNLDPSDPDSQIEGQSSAIFAMLTLNGRPWGSPQVMMQASRNQSFYIRGGAIGHVGSEQLQRSSVAWTWAVPVAAVGNGAVAFGFECEFASNIGPVSGVTNSDGSGAIEHAQMFVTPIIQPMAPVASLGRPEWSSPR